MLSKLLTKIGLAILVLVIFDLAYINWWVLSESKKVKEPEGQSVRASIVQAKDKNTASSSPIAISSPEPSGEGGQAKTVETRTVVEKQTQVVVQNAQKEVFIPIGAGSIKSGSYADVGGLEVSIDTDKYPAIASAVFEAGLWSDGGNGKVWAQLYNVSDKHPVWFSEISASSATSKFVSSLNITLGKGLRTYKVQAKGDQSDFYVHVENARIKITLK